jgi:hypothetical protein
MPLDFTVRVSAEMRDYLVLYRVDLVAEFGDDRHQCAWIRR